MKVLEPFGMSEIIYHMYFLAGDKGVPGSSTNKDLFQLLNADTEK